MSTLGILNPVRTCRFCKSFEVVSFGKRRNLVKYNTRHYAHWFCLVKAKGYDFAKAEVPEWQQAQMIREAPAHVHTEAEAVAEALRMDTGSKPDPVSTCGRCGAEYTETDCPRCWP